MLGNISKFVEILEDTITNNLSPAAPSAQLARAEGKPPRSVRSKRAARKL